MFYIPPRKIFRPEEIFPPHIVLNHTDKNTNIDPQIWRLMDSRVLWTAVQLRNEFGPMYVNTYYWGGRYKGRGYRDPISLIDYEYYNETGINRAFYSSFTSQHCFGRAIDSKFKKVLAEEARQYIIQNNGKDAFKYITAIEKEVSWLHSDVRNFKIADERFFLF